MVKPYKNIEMFEEKKNSCFQDKSRKDGVKQISVAWKNMSFFILYI